MPKSKTKSTEEKPFSQLGFFERFNKSIDFSLAFKAWDSKVVIYSILLASLFINILSLALPLALLQVYDRIIPNTAFNTLLLLAAGVLIALLFEGILRMCRSYVSAWADAKFEHVTGCKAFFRIMHSSLVEFENEGSAVHLKRINALNRLREFFSGQVVIALADVPYILVLIALIGYIGTWVVLIPIFMLIMFLILTVYHAESLQNILRSRHEHDDRRMNFIIETLSNIHTVKSISMEAQMVRRYERLQKSSSVYDYNVSRNGAGTMIMGLSLSQITIILVASFGSILAINGQITVGGLAACTLLSGRCLQPINVLVGVWTRLQTVKIATDDIKDILRMREESAPGLPAFPDMKGDIKFEHINFRYGEDQPYIYKDMNLHFEKGKVIGISSEGLSGKSTLAWLLMGIIKPDKGRVLIDGHDISKYDIYSVRDKIAYLPQKSVMFNGTIMENLTMFQVEKYHDRAKVIARALGLDTIIERLPHGYETSVADQVIESLPRGVNQRIAIARAFICNPKIVIFDEANIAIDMAGDVAIKNMLKRIVGRCTLIIISHRPSLLEMCDQHYEIKDQTLRLVKQNG